MKNLTPLGLLKPCAPVTCWDGAGRQQKAPDFPTGNFAMPQDQELSRWPYLTRGTRVLRPACALRGLG